MQHVPQIRIFLASPGDVNEERAVALQVLDMLEYDPLFKRNGTGGVSIHAVAWDKPGGDTPMRATMTPQTAIKQGLPRPSECDVVIVMFWGRMGTPLPYPEYQKPDGTAYLSGTEWEYWDAINAERATGTPATLIYRRTEKPLIELDDDPALGQYRSVRTFFDQFRDTTGALIGGVNEYKDPEDLRLKLLTHLRTIIDRLLGENPSTPLAPRVLVEAPPLWKGSPFPGLRAFTEVDAPIFFGRGQETSELVKRVEASRFTAVVAASGSGKSSLVAAGLIPRLKSNAIVSGDTGSKDWRFVRFTPGQAESPFAALFSALRAAFPEYKVDPFELPQRKKSFIDSISAEPASFVEICDALLREAKSPSWAEILFFIDQFEELLTLIPDERADERTAFVALLEAIHASARLRCIVTLRSDFTAQAIENPVLARLINQGNYMLAAPTAGALIEMIKRPAERAGLTWDDGLPERIQGDTGSNAGALALMAYALDELYQTSHADQRLTFSAYQAIGGVERAIGKRAESAFEKLLLPDKERLLQRVFRELVTVDERGTATRQRAPFGTFDQQALTLIRSFADARLLVTQDAGAEVAHEAIFRTWERLKIWIAEAQEDLILLRQVRTAAAEWETRKRRAEYRWSHERLNSVYEMLSRLGKSEFLSEVEREFVRPEADLLLEELVSIETTHYRRFEIGDRLAKIGDTRFGVGLAPNGLPEFSWCFVPSGKVNLDSISFDVEGFYIAEYPVTYKQYSAFLSASDGYKNIQWWIDLSVKPSNGWQQKWEIDNYPAVGMSWYEAIAFTRWLNQKYHEFNMFSDISTQISKVDIYKCQLHLPTEWEWQQAASGGNTSYMYPWGVEDDLRRCNTMESNLNRATAVGMYPQGRSPVGALDMSGTVWEWCLNETENPVNINPQGDAMRSICGSSWGDEFHMAKITARKGHKPDYWMGHPARGLRLILK